MTTIATCAFPGTYDVDKSVEQHLAYIDEAAAAGADLVVFPECSLQGYPPDFRASKSAAVLEPFYATVERVADGPNVTRIVEHAKARSLHVVFGMNEAGERPGVVYNSMVLAGPGGVIGVFRKVHVGITEQVFWRRGDDWPVYETPFGRIGMLICYDKAWPETCRELTLRGADILVMSTAWSRSDPEALSRSDPEALSRSDPEALSLSDPEAGADDVWLDQYALFDRVRAAENCRWFVSSNFVGELGGLEFFGMSQIVDPLGRVLATTGTERSGLVIAEVDVAAGIRAACALNQGAHLVRDRRPETYKALSGAMPIAIDG
jgi:predicted amidohydrolase